jgi:hypothetical protein
LVTTNGPRKVLRAQNSVKDIAKTKKGGIMTEEWEEVKHEIELILERLSHFRDDIMAARRSGALNPAQKRIVDRLSKEVLQAEFSIRNITK